MKYGLSTSLALAAAFALLAIAAPAAAQPDPGDRFEDLCIYACNGGSCDQGCKKLGVWTTCGEHWGNPANDLDSDGVANGGDNCVCAPNANQANCDGDPLGDACDGTDNSWTLIAVSPKACHVDIDTHFGFETIEMWYGGTYQSACTGQTCVKKDLAGSFNCYPDADDECCESHWSPIDCGQAWNYDNCGSPACPF